MASCLARLPKRLKGGQLSYSKVARGLNTRALLGTEKTQAGQNASLRAPSPRIITVRPRAKMHFCRVRSRLRVFYSSCFFSRRSSDPLRGLNYAVRSSVSHWETMQLQPFSQAFFRVFGILCARKSKGWPRIFQIYNLRPRGSIWSKSLGKASAGLLGAFLRVSPRSVGPPSGFPREGLEAAPGGLPAGRPARLGREGLDAPPGGVPAGKSRAPLGRGPGESPGTFLM